MTLNQMLEQRVETRSAKILKLIDELKRFTYDVVTEFQGPLAHLLNFSVMLANHLAAQHPEMQRSTDHIGHSRQCMHLLTIALLHYARESTSDGSDAARCLLKT
ncbi:hypothetical protein [Deinococcus hohokamensis]|uniref:Uncharacterized protein n=1 Tax=Deinococcus hohokamensis TaxID=309883 RepID=A0ABV9I8A2_9DEIO